VVRDGPSEKLFRLEAGVEGELTDLLPQTTRLVFLRRDSFDAGWDPEAAGRALMQAIQEPEVDLVFANGVLSTEQALKRNSSLHRPVVGGLLLEAGQPELSSQEKTKVHWVLIPDRIEKDLRAFHDLVGFSSLHFCADQAFLQGIAGFRERLVRLETELGFSIIPLPAGEDPVAVLNRLGPDAEAVYLTPLLRMSNRGWEKLIRALNERRLPTFSLFGHADVRQGVLASQTPDILSRLARRLALDMHQIIDGTAPKSLSRTLVVQDQLLVNGQTARQIGFDPSLSTMVNARVLHSEALGRKDAPAETLTLEKAMSMAGQRNVRVAIEEFRTREAQESTQQARSGFLPQAEAGLQSFRIDKDRSRASLSLTPWKRTSGSITVRQLIFDDSVLSGYLAAKHLEKGQALETRSIKLDVQARAGELFLQVLQAMALERIEKDNLELTRENLRLARVRRRVGMSGPEDVYRWETQEATQKGDLFAADSRVEKARVALNQVLGSAQSARWQLEDIRLQDEDLFFLDDRFRRLLQRASQVRSLREYGVKVALENSPELKAADQAVQAAEIDLGQKKRRFYVPSLGASLDYTREFHREDPDLSFGAGAPSSSTTGMAVPDIGSEVTDLVEDRDRDEWRVALELKLPLFQGGKRFHDVDKAQAALSRLRSQRARAAQLIEQQVRSAVYDLQSSQPRIGLARKAAEQAGKNLDLVQDRYARGAASILDLIDAQNQALAQDQAATIAVYRYLQDLIRFQRAMAWFEYEQSQQEKEAWIRGFTRFVPSTGRGERSRVKN
jgi:outer membrane protein TolC